MLHNTQSDAHNIRSGDTDTLASSSTTIVPRDLQILYIDLMLKVYKVLIKGFLLDLYLGFLVFKYTRVEMLSNHTFYRKRSMWEPPIAFAGVGILPYSHLVL